VDRDHIYVTGRTDSPDFPTGNPAQSSLLGNGDAFVTKISAAGDTLVYSTYLGGNEFDEGASLAIGDDGRAFVTGETRSADFPTAFAFQSVFGGGICGDLVTFPCADAFVAVHNAAGDALDYSTYLGGSGYDAGSGIAVNGDWFVSVTGFTRSSDFPTVNLDYLEPSAFFDSSLGGSEDAFVARISALSISNFDSLRFSTYLGGSGIDRGQGIVADDSYAFYVTGLTLSDDFPTEKPLQPARSGSFDAFVTKFAPWATLAYSTYLGGAGDDKAGGVAVDSSGNAYVTGFTQSNDFPTTHHAFQKQLRGPDDAFVTKLNAAGDALIFSTYLGGSDNRGTEISEGGNGIAVDPFGNAYVTGFTNATDFPTADPVQKDIGNTISGRF
jgi:hypothetical protein